MLFLLCIRNLDLLTDSVWIYFIRLAQRWTIFAVLCHTYLYLANIYHQNIRKNDTERGLGRYLDYHFVFYFILFIFFFNNFSLILSWFSFITFDFCITSQGKNDWRELHHWFMWKTHKYNAYVKTSKTFINMLFFFFVAFETQWCIWTEKKQQQFCFFTFICFSSSYFYYFACPPYNQITG